MKKEEVNEIIKEIFIITKKIKEIIPYGEIKEVKEFGKSKHIILPKDFPDKKAIVIKIPKE